MPSPEDIEITLCCGSHRVVVSPYGAALRRYYRTAHNGSEMDIVWGYSGGAYKKGGQGDVLIPFPSRIQEGRYTFEGETYQMERNDREGPNAIHGFLRSRTWSVEEEQTDRVRFRTQILEEEFADKGYPFSLDVSLIYSLNDEGLTCSYEVRNIGDRNAPVGLGFHPYFTVGTETVDETEALIPASHYLEFEPTLVPTGNLIAVDGTPYDFREFKPVGETRFNHCYTGLIPDEDGISRAHLRNPIDRRTVTLWSDVSFRYLVVYTGDAIPEPHARRALAIEPMTCATDAFNHPAWGLMVIGPHETVRGQFGVQSAF